MIKILLNNDYTEYFLGILRIQGISTMSSKYLKILVYKERTEKILGNFSIQRKSTMNF
jgi:hypothetical protein